MTITLHDGYPATVLHSEVAVYFRLPKHQRDWAIRVGDLVVAHADTLTLTGCRFVVNERMWRAGYEGTGKRGRKRNVVAWVTGKIADGEIASSRFDRRVTFRFFEHGDGSDHDRVGVFFDPATGETIADADAVRFTADGKAWI